MKLLKYNQFINENIQILNTNFWKWFDGSKVLDENNKPMICYHGSNISDIKTFDFSKIGYNSGNLGHYGYGIYFTDDIIEAKHYGRYIYKCYINIKNPFVGDDSQLLELKKEGVSIIDDEIILSIDYTSFKELFKNDSIIYNFLSDVEKYNLETAWDNIHKLNVKEYWDKLNDISDILNYTTYNKNVDGVADYIFTDLENMNVDISKLKLNKGFQYHQALHWITDLGNNSKYITEIIKKLGYDGVIYGSEIVAFYPNQIKSIDNDGSYDLDDTDISS